MSWAHVRAKLPEPVAARNPTDWVNLYPGDEYDTATAYFSSLMLPEKLVSWFLPANIRHNKAHPRYHELYTLASILIAGIISVCMFPVLLAIFHTGKHLEMYYVNAACHVLTLFSIRTFGAYRAGNLLAAAVTYFLIYTWVDDTGLIYSTNIYIIHMFLLAGVLADRKWGWTTIITNIVFLCLVYRQTISEDLYLQLQSTLGSPFYALLMNCLITAFLGGWLAYALGANEQSRKKLAGLQEQKIHVLDEAVRRRTEQLSSMRQTIATDFHDQTGNMLAAINRQAATLELRLHRQPELLPLVKSIIENSDDLYASSKDFLWNLNHDSDNPVLLFQYLTAYGQRFYNQFDIAFSAEAGSSQSPGQRMNPFAALNLIYIFKEAMSNIVKHSGAGEVTMKMQYSGSDVVYTLSDNGSWKQADAGTEHYGLQNMQRRSLQSGFGYKLEHGAAGTQIRVSVPMSEYFINDEAL